MTTAEIRQSEAGALAFGRETYGDSLADAMYLGTFGAIHYFGPTFYDSRISKQVQSFFITYADGKYSFLPAAQFKLDSDDDRKDFERRQHIWWDYIGAIQCAYERGRQQSIRRLKEYNLPTEQIAEYTGLTAEEINAL